MSIPPNRNRNRNRRNVLGGTHHHHHPRIGPAASPARGARAGGSIGPAVRTLTTRTTTTTITIPANLARRGTSRGTSRDTRRSRDVSGLPRLTLTRSDDTIPRHLVTTRLRLTLRRRRTTTVPLSPVAAVAGIPRHRLTGGKGDARGGIGLGWAGLMGSEGGFRNEQLQIREGAPFSGVFSLSCFFFFRVDWNEISLICDDR